VAQGIASGGPSIAGSIAMSRYPRHLRGFDYRGFHRYFLTFCTHERVPHFTSPAHVELVCEQIQRTCREEDFAGIAYCFMPDHLHLLVEGQREDADLKRFIRNAKQYSGFHFKQQTGRRLWQRYGYEHVLREEEDTMKIAYYIIANPVRAGMVSSPADYPHWGSLVYSREELLEYIRAA
jgi:putative transposase